MLGIDNGMAVLIDGPVNKSHLLSRSQDNCRPAIHINSDAICPSPGAASQGPRDQMLSQRSRFQRTAQAEEGQRHGDNKIHQGTEIEHVLDQQAKPQRKTNPY